MKKSLRPKMRPEKMMPGDEMIDTRTVEVIDITRPKMRPDDMEERGAVERGNRESEREYMDTQKYKCGGEVKYAGGGMVRGCKGSQVSGKGFRGTY